MQGGGGGVEDGGLRREGGRRGCVWGKVELFFHSQYFKVWSSPALTLLCSVW